MYYWTPLSSTCNFPNAPKFIIFLLIEKSSVFNFLNYDLVLGFLLTFGISLSAVDLFCNGETIKAPYGLVSPNFDYSVSIDFFIIFFSENTNYIDICFIWFFLFITMEIKWRVILTFTFLDRNSLSTQIKY